MRRTPPMQLPYAAWPAMDRICWDAAFNAGHVFDESGPGAHLADRTRVALQSSYGRFLGFLSAKRRSLLTRKPGARIDRKIIAEYVTWRRRSCGVSAIAIDLHHLRLALGLICPNSDWLWMLNITKRVAAQATRKPERYHLVTSEQLYALGIELMDRAVTSANDSANVTKVDIFDYRDGLIIALLALIPLRRRTLAALRVGKHLVKSGEFWSLDISVGDTKTKRALEYPISASLSARIDVYVNQFRRRVSGAEAHDGLWASSRGRSMDHGTIYDMVRRRTREAFGFPVNLHRFRHAAATLWSTHDPVNVRGVKDLLGQASFGTTEKHYIMARSRIAGRALARAIDGALARGYETVTSSCGARLGLEWTSSFH